MGLRRIQAQKNKRIQQSVVCINFSPDFINPQFLSVVIITSLVLFVPERT